MILSTELFNISLNLTQQNDSNAIYSCDVTVSHDGRRSATYPGGKFRILMTTDNGRGISTTRLWVCDGSITRDPQESQDHSRN